MTGVTCYVTKSEDVMDSTPDNLLHVHVSLSVSLQKLTQNPLALITRRDPEKGSDM